MQGRKRIAAARAVLGAARAALLALCGLASCGPSGPHDNGGARSAQVFVDGEPRLALERDALERPLDVLAALALAPADVQWIELRGDGDRVLKVKAPAERYPERTLAAFRSEGGVGAGWVDHVRGALPERVDAPPAVAFARVAEVHVRVTRIEEPRPGAATAATLRIETAAGLLSELSPSDLAGFPERTPREVLGQGEGSKQLAMTFLGEVLAASVPLAEVESVVVHTAAGETVTLDAACLVQPAPRAPLLKVNRRGEWRLKVYEPSGSGIAASANLRAVTRLEVRLRAR